jgi:hypothetical protein
MERTSKTRREQSSREEQGGTIERKQHDIEGAQKTRCMVQSTFLGNGTIFMAAVAAGCEDNPSRLKAIWNRCIICTSSSSTGGVTSPNIYSSLRACDEAKCRFDASLVILQILEMTSLGA